LRRFAGHLRANVIEYLALVLALCGTSYAFAALPANVVGTPQLRDEAVTLAKFSPAAVQILQSAQGAVGPSGPAGPQGLAGPSRPVSGTFRSPSGSFELSVDDTGITLKGPTGSLHYDGSQLKATSASVSADGATTTSLQGGVVSLGGSGSTCKPLARVGDLAGTWIKPSPFAPTILVGVVTTGSSRVLACG